MDGSSPSDLYDVAVSLPLEGSFSYQLPSSLKGRVREGCLVWVPFGRRRILGVVLGPTLCPPSRDTKEILQLVEEEPVLSPHELRWYRWASGYYLHPLGGILKTALSALTGRRACVRLTLTEMGRRVLRSSHPPEGLELLESSPNGIPFQRLEKLWGIDRAEERISLWRKQGWVNIRLEASPGVGGDTRLWAAITSQGRRCLATGEEHLGTKQWRVLRELSHGRETAVSILEKSLPGARSSLKGLQRKGLVRLRRGGPHSVIPSPSPPPPSPVLTAHQREALKPIHEALVEGRFAPFLLWGVTGSGKTEVYLRAVQACVKTGREAIVLVPEISLTPQMISEFRSRFGDRIAVLHSRLSPSERSSMWRAIWKGELPVVLGARSALFAPCRRLGLLIVDEEHDASYKQEEGFRYHARDMALMRGKLSSGVVILGSASPSLETFHNSQSGKIRCLVLPERIDGRPLPPVEVVDLRGLRSSSDGPAILSPALETALRETLDRGQQSLLFLNRRGYAPVLVCTECGEVLRCSRCEVSLVYHRSEGVLKCHYCGGKRPAPAMCPSCGGFEVRTLGFGTEALEAEIRRRFPEARILRMDRDTTTRKHAHKEILETWRKGEADILIGTQMVTKGHHVPNVTLVGVVLADLSLNLPDFRSAERTFQLLLQVSGRAGRGERPGRVIVQTYRPDHPSIHCAASQDYLGFAFRELKARREAGYPPFWHLILFRVTGTCEEDTTRAADRLGEISRAYCQASEEMVCLGPSPSPLARLKGRYRWQLLLKGRTRPPLKEAARRILKELTSCAASRRVRIQVDVDPQTFL